ncbi:BIR7B-like protein [Mya arenaria]|uniref:BIR7B-like protein n=1 Tax=Mya arenaria TaxID=6604 RepID=A0ABY7EI82_MYAAR|nr:BIR7B-like protein [Mya arenaria]
MHESSCLESVRKDSGAQCPPMTANFFTVFQIDVMYMCVTMERLSHPTRSICFGLKPKSDVTPGSNGVEDLLVHNDTPKTNDDYIKDLGDQEDPPDIEDFKDLLEPKNTNTDADLTQKNNKYYVSDVQNAISRKNGTCEELYVENDVQDGEADEESEVDLVNFGSEIDLHLHSTFLKANEAKICDTESVLSDLREDHGNCGCDMGTFYKMSVGPDKTFVCLPNPEKTKDVSHEDKMPQFTLKVLPNPPNNFERYSQVKSVQDNSLLNCFERKFVKEDQQSRGKQYDLTLLESDIESLRKVSWLPLHNLPVPKVEIDVHYVDQFPPLVAIITQIAEGNTPRPQISMRYELLRLCTLRTYPRENKPYLIKLAAAGFYYASDGDGVVCYCCGIRRYGWTEKDDPMAVHKRINQHCKFFKKNAEYNVPATSFGPLSEKEAFLDAIPDCEVPNYSEDVNNDNDNNRQSGQPTTQNRTGLGIQTSMPKHPQYAPKTTRENSYNGWPNTSSHTPIELAEAGFYFAGFGDCVRCFHCGIGLRHWDKEDNVWIEHARWSKDCVFLLQKKGREFVELVQLAVQYTNELEDQTGATDPKAIKEENEQLKEQTVCKVCLDNTVSIVFLPCGHLVTCADCAPAMRKCPICRAVVKGTVRTYMS